MRAVDATTFFKRLGLAFRRHGIALGKSDTRIQFSVADEGEWVIDFARFRIDRKKDATCQARVEATRADLSALLSGRPGNLRLFGDPATFTQLVRLMMAR